MKTYIAMLALIFGGAVAFLWVDYHQNKNVVLHTVYSGREYFESTEEYSHFKRYLVHHPEVKVREITALSSPDALVDFEVEVDGEGAFPYGDVDRVGKGADMHMTWLMTLLFTWVGFVLGGVGWLVRDMGRSQ